MNEWICHVARRPVNLDLTMGNQVDNASSDKVNAGCWKPTACDHHLADWPDWHLTLDLLLWCRSVDGELQRLLSWTWKRSHQLRPVIRALFDGVAALSSVTSLYIFMQVTPSCKLAHRMQISSLKLGHVWGFQMSVFKAGLSISNTCWCCDLFWPRHVAVTSLCSLELATFYLGLTIRPRGNLNMMTALVNIVLWPPLLTLARGSNGSVTQIILRYDPSLM